MIDDEVAGHHRVDPLGIAADSRGRVAHCGEIHHTRHAGKVLQHHAGGHIGDLTLTGTHRSPGREGPDVLLGDETPPDVSERIFEQHADGEGEGIEAGQAGLFERLKRMDDGRAGTGSDRGARVEWIGVAHSRPLMG